jgi:hypothetical protein
MAHRQTALPQPSLPPSALKLPYLLFAEHLFGEFSGAGKPGDQKNI